MSVTSGNKSLDYAIMNKGKMESIVGEFRRKHDKKSGDYYLSSLMFLGTGLSLLDVEKYFTVLK